MHPERYGDATGRLLNQSCRHCLAACPEVNASVAGNYFCFIMSRIIICMSLTLTMPLLSFFILSYMDS